MTWNVTAGDLGRAAMYDDPTATAEALGAWCGGDVERFGIIEWLRFVADSLEVAAEDAP